MKRIIDILIDTRSSIKENLYVEEKLWKIQYSYI